MGPVNATERHGWLRSMRLWFQAAFQSGMKGCDSSKVLFELDTSRT